MKILITGSGGLVGSHLAVALASEHQVLAFRHADLDITDAAKLRRVMHAERPSLIINCAVVGVDECEQDPALARTVNVSGPRILAEAGSEIGAEFLHFSSNYVFEGNRTNGIPYTANDETRPINIYGLTKLEGERDVRAVSPRTYIVRTSWVFGSGKATLLSTAYDLLRRGRAVRTVTDTYACTTYVGDLVKRTGEILARHRYGVYQIVNEGTISQHDFTVECARRAGLSDLQAERLIELVTEAEMSRLAPRPRWTPMSCLLSAELELNPMREWRIALADYIRHTHAQLNQG